jgi:hypothetical protein
MHKPSFEKTIVPEYTSVRFGAFRVTHYNHVPGFGRSVVWSLRILRLTLSWADKW